MLQVRPGSRDLLLAWLLSSQSPKLTGVSLGARPFAHSLTSSLPNDPMRLDVGTFHCAHSTDDETETQRNPVACSRSHSRYKVYRSGIRSCLAPNPSLPHIPLKLGFLEFHHWEGARGQNQSRTERPFFPLIKKKKNAVCQECPGPCKSADGWPHGQPGCTPASSISRSDAYLASGLSSLPLEAGPVCVFPAIPRPRQLHNPEEGHGPEPWGWVASK